jgi:hypothetical protein
VPARGFLPINPYPAKVIEKVKTGLSIEDISPEVHEFHPHFGILVKGMVASISIAPEAPQVVSATQEIGLVELIFPKVHRATEAKCKNNPGVAAETQVKPQVGRKPGKVLCIRIDSIESRK